MSVEKDEKIGFPDLDLTGTSYVERQRAKTEAPRLEGDKDVLH